MPYRRAGKGASESPAGKPRARRRVLPSEAPCPAIRRCRLLLPSGPAFSVRHTCRGLPACPAPPEKNGPSGMAGSSSCGLHSPPSRPPGSLRPVISMVLQRPVTGLPSYGKLYCSPSLSQAFCCLISGYSRLIPPACRIGIAPSTPGLRLNREISALQTVRPSSGCSPLSMPDETGTLLSGDLANNSTEGEHYAALLAPSLHRVPPYFPGSPFLPDPEHLPATLRGAYHVCRLPRVPHREHL